VIVNAVRDHKKAAFPTEVVYGAKDLSRPQLRLITCSDFDPLALVGLSALAAVVVTRYAQVPAFGPMPSVDEPVWFF
jgi:hypothetical protein